MPNRGVDAGKRVHYPRDRNGFVDRAGVFSIPEKVIHGFLNHRLLDVSLGSKAEILAGGIGLNRYLTTVKRKRYPSLGSIDHALIKP